MWNIFEMLYQDEEAMLLLNALNTVAYISLMPTQKSLKTLIEWRCAKKVLDSTPFNRYSITKTGRFVLWLHREKSASMWRILMNAVSIYLVRR